MLPTTSIWIFVETELHDHKLEPVEVLFSDFKVLIKTLKIFPNPSEIVTSRKCGFCNFIKNKYW